MSTRRQFIIAPALARLIQGERGGERVREGYFPDRQPRTALVRVGQTSSSLVLLSDSPEGPTEERVDIPAAHAQALLAATAGQVEYIRTDLSVGSTRIALQHVIRPGALDLVVVEPEDGQDFHPLPWLGPEVSGNPAYQAWRMALSGPPEVPEVEPSDEALNSLLDLLENRFTSWPAPQVPAAAQDEPLDQPAPSGRAEPPQPPDDDQDEDDLGIEDDVIRELARSLRPQRS